MLDRPSTEEEPAGPAASARPAAAAACAACSGLLVSGAPAGYCSAFVYPCSLQLWRRCCRRTGRLQDERRWSFACAIQPAQCDDECINKNRMRACSAKRNRGGREGCWVLAEVATWPDTRWRSWRLQGNACVRVSYRAMFCLVIATARSPLCLSTGTAGRAQGHVAWSALTYIPARRQGRRQVTVPSGGGRWWGQGAQAPPHDTPFLPTWVQQNRDVHSAFVNCCPPSLGGRFTARWARGGGQAKHRLPHSVPRGKRWTCGDRPAPAPGQEQQRAGGGLLLQQELLVKPQTANGDRAS